MMGTYCVKERNVEGQTVVDFAKRMEMAVVSKTKCIQVDYVLCRRCNLKMSGDYEI